MSRNFIDPKRRSPGYQGAVAALRLLIAEAGIDAASRAFSEAISDDARERWIKSRGVRQSRGEVCLARLLGGHCNHFNSYESSEDDPPQHRAPAADHESLWTKGGKPELYVSQPYGFSLENMRESVALCDRHDLSVHLSAAPAWHFPYHVLHVEWRRKGNGS